MISIIVVTFNRHKLVQQCLQSIIEQRFAGEYEVVIVDNASTDGTEEYFKQAVSERIKYIRNSSVMSLSRCKELGFKSASGSVVAFTDDDCLPAKEWLASIQEAMATYDVVGGPVLPAGGITLPWWWRKSMEWLLGINPDPGMAFLPLGSNMAFRRDVFHSLELPVGQEGGMKADPYGEDNARVRAALISGFRLGINNKMIVFHQIDPQRLTFYYFIKRSYSEGECWARREPAVGMLLLRLMALLVNPVRLLLTWDLNRFFRMVVSVGYLVTYMHLRQR